MGILMVVMMDHKATGIRPVRKTDSRTYPFTIYVLYDLSIAVDLKSGWTVHAMAFRHWLSDIIVRVTATSDPSFWTDNKRASRHWLKMHYKHLVYRNCLSLTRPLLAISDITAKI